MRRYSLEERGQGPEAAEALKLTAQDLLARGIIDGNHPRAAGRAHRDPERAAANIKEALGKYLAELTALDTKSCSSAAIKSSEAWGW